MLRVGSQKYLACLVQVMGLNIVWAGGEVVALMF